MKIVTKANVPEIFHETCVESATKLSTPLQTMFVILSLVTFNIFIFSGFSIFHLGYCHDSDFAHVSFWLLSFVQGVALMATKARLSVIALLKTPLPHVIFVLYITTVGLSFFHESTVLSFLGSAQMAEGAMSLLSFLITTLTFSILCQEERTRKTLLNIALFSGLTHIGIALLGTEEGWHRVSSVLEDFGLTVIGESPPLRSIVPHWFPDYIIFVLLPTFVLFLLRIASHEGLFIQRGSVRTGVLCGGMLVVIFAYILMNHSFSVSLCIGTLGCVTMYAMRRIFSPSKALFLYLILGGSLVMVAIFLSPDFSWIPDNIQSRGYLAQIVLPRWPYDFSFQGFVDIFVGRGWGTYDQLLTQNIDLIKVHQYQGSSWNPSWESFVRDQFHTHNSALEYYVSLGLVGVTVGGYSLYVISTNLRNAYFYLGSFYLFAMTILCSAWFQVLSCVPYNILVLCLILKDKPLSSPIQGKILARAWKVLPLSLVLLPLAAVGLGSMTYAIRNTHMPEKPETLVSESMAFIHSDLNHLDRLQGYYRMNKVLSLWLSLAPEGIKQKTITSREAFAVTKAFAHKLYEGIKTKRMPHSRVLILNLLALNGTHPELKKHMQEEDYRFWIRFSQEFLDSVPQRASVLHLTLAYLVSVNDTVNLIQILDKMDRVAPNNPVALWFRGFHLFGSTATTKEGVALLYSALQRGVNNVIPINPQHREKIIQIHKQMFPHDHLFGG
ncbi:MAG: hypothetical protein H6849_01750 [Alphaproteobacteria bacterium]|nr:MAG: hypothetical protein H6849_01750 [Alphaproteobacteria bacterium]